MRENYIAILGQRFDEAEFALLVGILIAISLGGF